MKLHTAKRVIGIFGTVLLIAAIYGPFVPDGARAVYTVLLFLGIVALGVIDALFWRCPHCHSYLYQINLWWAQYCPRCGGDLYDEENEWYSDYARLNYKHGELQVFENGGSDMLLVTYKDGMQIHVGYDSDEHQFVITVLADDSEEAKASPLAVHRVFGQNQLLTALQNTVHTWRDDKEV